MSDFAVSIMWVVIKRNINCEEVMNGCYRDWKGGHVDSTIATRPRIVVVNYCFCEKISNMFKYFIIHTNFLCYSGVEFNGIGTNSISLIVIYCF